MARWRTSGALVLLALATAACGQTTASDATTTRAQSRPQLSPVQQQPLRVEGTGFHPGEKVRLAAKGLKTAQASARADDSGRFTATFEGLKNCDSVTVTAVGSKGSHVEFNLSQIACVDE